MGLRIGDGEHRIQDSGCDVLAGVGGAAVGLGCLQGDWP